MAPLLSTIGITYKQSMTLKPSIPQVNCQFILVQSMVAVKHTLAALAAYLTTASAVIFKPQNEYKALSADNASFAINLQPWFNNRAFGLKPNDSSFDGDGSV